MDNANSQEPTQDGTPETAQSVAEHLPPAPSAEPGPRSEPDPSAPSDQNDAADQGPGRSLRPSPVHGKAAAAPGRSSRLRGRAR